MPPLLWYFFGTLCMANAPTDCERIVFDVPREVADLAHCCDKRAPPVFSNAKECIEAMSSELRSNLPLKVMGSEWTQLGCAQK